METTTGAVTVSTAVLDVTLLAVAVMLLVPGRAPVARPLLSLVAMPLAVEFQAAVVETSKVLLSEYVAIAVNCRVSPLATDAGAGVTATDITTGAVTVRTE